MKIINLTLVIFAILSSFLPAQKGKFQDEEAREKFEQLEKIKLIETLQMDEETTLRFFSRRTEHRNQQDAIQEKIKSNIDNLDVMLKSGRAVSIEELKSKINEINTLELQLEKNKVEFLNSLSDILSYEQIAQMIIFEKRFRNEVRKLLMKERRPPIEQE